MNGVTQSGVVTDTTAITYSFPVLPANQLVREFILSTLEDMFKTGVQVITVEGAEEVGKTTLLAQFSKRHVANAINVFIRPTSWFAYDPQLLLRDICNQINFVLRGTEISDETQTDMSLYRQLTFSLQKFARQRDTEFFFVIDGLEEVPNESQARTAIIDLLPLGMSHLKFLISGKAETVLPHLGAPIQHKPFVLFGFALEETITYFSDLKLDKSFVTEIFQIFNRGIPGQMASIRRLLESGIPPLTVLSDLSQKAPSLFELEWKTVDASNEKLLNLLALIAHTSQKHAVPELAGIVGISTEQVRNHLAPLTFILLPKSDSEPVKFVSERFREFVSNRLASRQSIVRELAIDYFLKRPESESALSMLPNYLEEANRLEDLLTYLSPEHLMQLLERTGSTMPVRQKADQGLNTALRLGRDGDLFRFGIQRSAVTEFDRCPTLRSEVQAWIALGEYQNALAIAQGAVLLPDRLRLLAAIARFQKEKGLTPEAEVVQELGILARQIDPVELGRRCVQLASDLMFCRPDLGIGLIERMKDVSDEGDEFHQDWAFAQLSVDALVNAKLSVVRTFETSLAARPSYGLSFSSTLGFWFQRPRL